MKNILLLLVFFSNIMAPLPPGVAYNPETKACGAYFGGDEYGGYVLASPWVVSYDLAPATDHATQSWDEIVQEYCVSNGYTYVPGNMGELYGTHKRSSLYYTMLICKIAPFILLAAVILTVVSIIMRRKRRKKVVPA